MAAVLASGVIVIYHWEALRAGLGLFAPPAFFVRLAESGENFVRGEAEGKVLRTEIRNGSLCFLVDCGGAYGTVRLHTKLTPKGALTLPEVPKKGDRVRFSGSFFLYAEARNPGEFDVRKHYLAMNVHMGCITEEAEVLKKSPRCLRGFLEKLRLRIHVFLENTKSEDGVLEALLTGEKGGADDETNLLFDRYGFLFFLTVSGIHVGIVGSLADRILKKLTGSFPVRAFFSILAVSSFCILTGAGTAGIRAFLIHAVKVFAPLFKRCFDRITAFSLAMLLILLEYPLYVLTAGFWYGLAALLSMGVILPEIREFFFAPKRGFLYILSFLLIQCLLLPVRLYFSFGVSAAGLLSAMLSSLVLSFVLLTGLFGSVAGTVLTGLPVFSGGSGAAVFKAAGALISPSRAGIALIRFFTEAGEKIGIPYLVNGRPGALRILIYLLPVFLVFLWFLRLNRKNRFLPEKEEIRPKKVHTAVLPLILFSIYVSGLLLLKAEKAQGGTAELLFLDVG